MDAARHLAEFLDHARQSIREAADLRPYVLEAGGNPALCGAQPKGQRDQLLLSSVVEVALDAPTGFVARGDDAGAGSGDFGAHRRVRNGGRDELGEGGESRLSVGWERFVVSGGYVDASPNSSIDDDRDAGRRPDSAFARDSVEAGSG